MSNEPTFEPLPFVAWGGQRVIESKLSLGGSISHAEAQPPKAYTVPGERVVFVVVAYTNGQATAPAEAEDTLAWENKFRLAEAYEWDGSEAENKLDELREVVRHELGQLATGDKPDHTPTAAKKRRGKATTAEDLKGDGASITIITPNADGGTDAIHTTAQGIKAAAEAMKTPAGKAAIKAAAARTRAAAKKAPAK